MRTRNLSRLVKILRDNGVTHYKEGGLELVLGPRAPERAAPPPAPPAKRAAPTPERLAAQQMLAAAGLDEDGAADLAASLGRIAGDA